MDGGPLGERKGLSSPGIGANIPSLTEKDRDDLRWAVEAGADLLALSSGTDPKKLAQPGETMDQLDATLAYLVTFGWVGLTVTMDRVYVYSESREALA